MSNNTLKDLLGNEKPKKSSMTFIWDEDTCEGDIIWDFPKQEEKKKATNPIGNKTRPMPDSKAEEGKMPNPGTITVGFTKGDMTTAEVISQSDGVAPYEVVNALLVAMCKRASSLMKLNYEALFIKMSEAMLEAIYEATTDELFRLLNNDLEEE